jgi:hypothetical protein
MAGAAHAYKPHILEPSMRWAPPKANRTKRNRKKGSDLGVKKKAVSRSPWNRAKCGHLSALRRPWGAKGVSLRRPAD